MARASASVGCAASFHLARSPLLITVHICAAAASSIRKPDGCEPRSGSGRTVPSVIRCRAVTRRQVPARRVMAALAGDGRALPWTITCEESGWLTSVSHARTIENLMTLLLVATGCGVHEG